MLAHDAVVFVLFDDVFGVRLFVSGGDDEERRLRSDELVTLPNQLRPALPPRGERHDLRAAGDVGSDRQLDRQALARGGLGHREAHVDQLV